MSDTPQQSPNMTLTNTRPQKKAAIFLCAALACTTLSTPALAEIDLPFTPHADLRWRLEYVDQQGLAKEAFASTLRVRAGLETDKLLGFSALVEGEAIIRLGPADYNDGVNGKTHYPIVADPSDYALNQLALKWSDDAIGTATVGRQAVALGNQRWVGPVGWRQNDQTMDAARMQITALPGLTVDYVYSWRVNRVFGPRSAQGIWRDTHIHLLNATARFASIGQISTYAHWLDIPASPTSSTRTVGARLAGQQNLGGAVLHYAAEYAHQSDHGANPFDYGLDYLLLEPGLGVGPFTARIGFERMAGNGQAALQTPLATMHAFNGWADKFLTTPVDGLRDVYVDMTLAPKAQGVPQGLTLRAVYHDYRSTRGNRPYGREWDFQIASPVSKQISVMAKAALYQSRGFATDTMKLWLQAEAKF